MWTENNLGAYQLQSYDLNYGTGKLLVDQPWEIGDQPVVYGPISFRADMRTGNWDLFRVLLQFASGRERGGYPGCVGQDQPLPVDVQR